MLQRQRDKGSSGKREDSDLQPKDIPGRIVFFILLLLIPITTVVSLGVLTGVMADSNVASRTENRAPDGSVTSVTTTFISPTLTLTSTPSLGALDPAFGQVRGFLIGPVILLVAAVLETGLLLIYGAFYVRTENDNEKDNPLGLAKGTVRVFIVILIGLLLILFAFLPDAWGNNKAVSFFLGAFTTVVGFYFGTSVASEAVQDRISRGRGGRGGGRGGGNGGSDGDQTDTTVEQTRDGDQTTTTVVATRDGG